MTIRISYDRCAAKEQTVQAMRRVNAAASQQLQANGECDITIEEATRVIERLRIRSKSNVLTARGKNGARTAARTMQYRIATS